VPSNSENRRLTAIQHGLLKAPATETVPLFDHLEFEFLLEYLVFAPSKRGRTRVHKPPDLFRGFLHCYYTDVYSTRPVT